MTPQEALEHFEKYRCPFKCCKEALAVLRSVVEDYEEARPLIDAAKRSEVYHYQDVPLGRDEVPLTMTTQVPYFANHDEEQDILNEALLYNLACRAKKEAHSA